MECKANRVDPEGMERYYMKACKTCGSEKRSAVVSEGFKRLMKYTCMGGCGDSAEGHDVGADNADDGASASVVSLPIYLWDKYCWHAADCETQTVRHGGKCDCGYDSMNRAIQGQEAIKVEGPK